jgi:hypothetical protein
VRGAEKRRKRWGFAEQCLSASRRRQRFRASQGTEAIASAPNPVAFSLGLFLLAKQKK